MATEITKKSEYDAEVQKSQKCAVLFHAKWHGPSKQLYETFRCLTEDFPAVCFIVCDSDVTQEIVEAEEVKFLPTVLLYDDGKIVLRLAGANPPALIKQLQNLVGGSLTAAPISAEAEPQEELNSRLKRLVNSNRVMMFIKGCRSQPFCRFSKAAMEIMNQYEDVQFGTFDILQDDEVREGLKAYSNWPTFPQIYIDGELIGGVDILKEMHADGSLRQEFSKLADGGNALDDRLKKLVVQRPTMLFMKGTLDAPKCKFSRAIVDMLKTSQVEFGHFDVLNDNEVREGLKKYSSWPTYPQLYSGGQLVGGFDIVKEVFSASGPDGLKRELGLPESNSV